MSPKKKHQPSVSVLSSGSLPVGLSTPRADQPGWSKTIQHGQIPSRTSKSNYPQPTSMNKPYVIFPVLLCSDSDVSHSHFLISPVFNSTLLQGDTTKVLRHPSQTLPSIFFHPQIRRSTVWLGKLNGRWGHGVWRHVHAIRPCRWKHGGEKTSKKRLQKDLEIGNHSEAMALKLLKTKDIWIFLNSLEPFGHQIETLCHKLKPLGQGVNKRAKRVLMTSNYFSL